MPVALAPPLVAVSLDGGHPPESRSAEPEGTGRAVPRLMMPDAGRIRALADELEAAGHASLAALARRVAEEVEGEGRDE